MNLETWKNNGKYIEIGHFKIFYHEEGIGENLVLLHGFPTASWDWNRIYLELTKKFHVISFDFLGFGFSDKPKEFPYSIFSEADLSEKFLNKLNIKKAHFLVHDYGVTIMQELLARFRDKNYSSKDLEINSICFLNGGLFPETHKPRIIQKLLLSNLGFLISKFMNQKQFSKSFSKVFGENTQPTKEELDDFWQLIIFHEGNLLSHKLIHYMNERKKHRERWVLPLVESKIPIRLINGPADPISGIHMVENYKKHVKNSDVILLGEKIGHYPQVEAPKEVLKHFFQFHNLEYFE
jgi:pimeloyl-ACP methyl ester carboxylesterase